MQFAEEDQALQMQKRNTTEPHLKYITKEPQKLCK